MVIVVSFLMSGTKDTIRDNKKNLKEYIISSKVDVMTLTLRCASAG